ncbi:MAG: hypothetical protein J6Q92_00015 [Oscillospiraceae bacterium]|nr:hypothetical protein [Oscillospiraceae bacterium]
MSKRIRTITQTAVMLALLIALQTVTKPLGQLVTGSCVNAVLAITALVVGLWGGIAVALISPVCAFLLGIAPNFVTVLPIMLGNTCFVVLLNRICAGRPLWRQGLGLAAAAAVKLGALYLLVVKLICGVASNALLGQKIGQTVVLAPPMLKMLPAMFTWPQLFTALIGGAAALVIASVLNKALHK